MEQTKACLVPRRTGLRMLTMHMSFPELLQRGHQDQTNQRESRRHWVVFCKKRALDSCGFTERLENVIGELTAVSPDEENEFYLY